MPQRCGNCGGRLQLSTGTNKDGTPATPRKASGFSLFVKEQFAVAQRSIPGSPAPAVMKKLAAMWKVEKAKGQVR